MKPNRPLLAIAFAALAALACSLGSPEAPAAPSPSSTPGAVAPPPSPEPPAPEPTEPPPLPAATAEPVETETPPAPVACEAGSAEQSPLSGHTVMRTTSTDGVSFEPEGELVREHASVPDGVIGPDGAQWVYFVNGEPGRHGVFAAREAAPGEWVVVDCVRLDGQFVGDAVDPDVVRLSDGRYRLFYFLGHFVTRPVPGENLHPIFSAISDDGLNFTVEQELIAVENITDPTAVELPNGSWLLAVAQAQEGRTLLATSPDGYSFELTDRVFEGGGIPELGLLADGTVVLYTSGISTSSDGGESWAQVSGARVPGNGADPSLVTLPDGSYFFYYKTIEGQPGAPPPPTP